jgi:hypothetical protein
MNNPARSGMLLLASASCLMAVAQEPDLPRLAEKAPAVPLKDALTVQQPAPRSALPDKATIQAAVRSVLDESPALSRLHEADTLRANQYDKFSRQVEEATVPDCLHADGLKRQPTFFISGWLALPFVAVAKIRGKCQ